MILLHAMATEVTSEMVGAAQVAAAASHQGAQTPDHLPGLPPQRVEVRPLSE